MGLPLSDPRDLLGQIRDMRDKIDRLTRRGINEDWHAIGDAGEPAFLNSWVNYGLGEDAAQYRIDSAGVVHLRGVIKTGAVGSIAFILPAGYRPSAGKYFGVVSNWAFGGIKINANGEVILVVGSSTWAALDEVSFQAA